MSTTTDKIVKVEDLGNTGEHFTEDILLGNESDVNVKILHDFQPNEKWKIAGNEEHPETDSGVLVSINIPDLPNIDEDAFESEPLELEDVLRRLPAGWPCIPQLQQPHSWDYSTAVSPSVNQAVSRLELLQTAIEEWFRESQRRHSSIASHGSSPHADSIGGATKPALHTTGQFPGRYMIPEGDSLSITTENSTASIVTPRLPSALCVKGTGVLTSSASRSGRAHRSRDLELPCLGADIVIDEVMTLLATLELDRKETMRRLQHERDRVAWLQRKIDEYCEWRLLNMPHAVHREHEACMADISELTWHVSYRGRLAVRLKKNVDITEGILAKVEDEINLALRKMPLVQGKLELEAQCVEKIVHTQADVKEELELTTKRSEKMLSKNEDVEEKVSIERKTIKSELDTVDQSLQKVSHKMDMLNMTHATYTQLAIDYRKKHEKNMEEIKALEQRETLLTEQKEREATEIRTKKRKLAQMASDKKHLQDEIALCELQMENEKRAQAAEEKKLRAAIDRMEDNLANLNLANRDMNMNTEDIYSKINSSEKKAAQNEKNYQRALREMEGIMKESKGLAKEVEAARLTHEAASKKMAEEEQKARQVEEKLRMIGEELVTQIQDEVQSRNVIEARIHVERNQMEAVEEQLERNMEKAAKLLAEVNNALGIVKEKVGKLQAVVAQKDEEIAKLNNELTDAIEKKEETLKNNETALAEIIPVKEKIQDKFEKVTKAIQKMDTKKTMIEKKIEEIKDSSKMMDKSCAVSQNTISELKEEVEELDIRLETKQASRFSISSSLDDVTERMTQLTNCHKDQVTARKGVLKKTQEELIEALSINSQLASQYRSLQNVYLFAKEHALEQYDSQVTRENVNKDMKDLQALQERMHDECKRSYERRGANVMLEREHLIATAHSNSLDMTSLRDSMSGRLSSLHKFLASQEDGESIRKTAMAKAEEEEE